MKAILALAIGVIAVVLAVRCLELVVHFIVEAFHE